MSDLPERRNESELIAHYFAPLSDAVAAFGLSDDTAFLSIPDKHDLVTTKDMLVADIHFFASDPPEKIAQKALRVNLSDLAAKGAMPFGYLLGLGLPKGWDEEWLARFCSGLKTDQNAFQFPLFGGDTVKSPERLTLSVTAFGLVPKGQKLLRKNAEPAQALYVTGTIGDGALGLQVALGKKLVGLDHKSNAFLHDRYLLPQPRLGYKDVIARYAVASMDISDGLLGDAAKMARAAGVNIELVQENVPLSEAARKALQADPSLWSTVLGGGDDYELLLTIAPENVSAFEKHCHESRLPVCNIGTVKEGEGISLISEKGERLDQEPTSFEHF